MGEKHVTIEIEQYAENTTIHGIKDFITSKHKILKVTWGLLLMGAAGLMCEEIYRSTKNFQDEPTAMDVQYVSINKFPTINILITNWFNDSKARSLGFDDKDLAYIKRVFNITETSPIIAKYQHDMDTNSTFREEIKTDIKTKMEQHNLSSVEDMVGILSVNVWPTLVTKRRWNREGVIYSMDLNFTNNSKNPMDLAILPMPVKYEGQIVLGEDWYRQAVFTWRNQTETISLRVREISKTKFLNKRRGFCNEKYDSIMVCMLDCTVERYLCLQNGTSPMPTNYNNESFWQLDEERPVDPNSSLAMQCNEHCQLCINKCQPCINWDYDVSEVVERKSSFGYEGPLLFVFSVTKMKVSEEYYAYKTASFLGDVGGLVSLFCGASVLSLVQLFMFCFGKGFCGKQGVELDNAKKREEEFVKLHEKYCKACMATVAKP